MSGLKEKNKKTRKKNEQSNFKKTLNTIRKYHTPLNVIEIEIKILPSQHYKMMRIGEHLRIIRNTVVGVLFKNYKQMVRTKKYRALMKQYRLVTEKMSKQNADIKLLDNELDSLKEKLEELREKYNVTFDFARNFGAEMRERKFSLPDAVTVLSVCEMAWKSIEKILFSDGENPYFYKRNDFVTFQGKQAERCIILKKNKKNSELFVSHNGMNFSLIIKKTDLFIQESLSRIVHYMENSVEIDKENVERHLSGKSILPTYRIRNNRIVRKEIRGKIRYFLQIVSEGNPVVKRKKDGSFRHTFGTGRIGGDIGTQSIAIFSKGKVLLKNLAERSNSSFKLEREITNIQRYIDRSRRTMNPKNYNADGTIKKGKKTWVFSNRYLNAQRKLRNLQRKAAESRKYAHNEDINHFRTLGDELIIESMNIKALQKKAKVATKSDKTGKWNKRKRFGKSILNRSPGYFIEQVKYRFRLTGGTVKEVNTWTFKASQYDHVLDTENKKQLSKRWHTLPCGTKIQRDLYSAFLLYCSEKDLQKPNNEMCHNTFEKFYQFHELCIKEIKNNRMVVLNSGIKIS